MKMVAISSSAGSDSSSIAEASAASVDIIASLIGCTPQAISKGLCFRSIKTNEEIVVVPNTKLQACDARDALSKALYGRVFDWIVARINESFTTSASQQKNFIGILDIFGFEFFDINSFEQLCINYANEMLQNQFNAFVFQLEQVEYAAEGIPWSYIEFFDNKPCLDAIGGKSNSVLACLDEECLVPAGSDSGFCNKVRAIKSKFLKAPPKHQSSFTVCHYAGEVEYVNVGFLDKNRDSLALDISDMLAASSSSFVADLFPSAKREKRSSVASGAKASGAKKSQMSQPTLGAQFQKSLLALIDIIVKTQPHYVRCITPNSHKKSGEINNARVVQQLQCSGVIEAVRVTRAGFPSRFLYDDFVRRYRVISPSSCVADNRQSSAALLAAAGLEAGASVQMGKTKVFLKLAAVDSLDKHRVAALGVFATKFNRCVRGWLCRVRVRKWRAGVAAASCLLLRTLRFQEWQRRRQLHAAVSIQARARCSLHFRRHSRHVTSCNLLLSRLRCIAAVSRYSGALRHHAAAVLQSHFRTHVAESFHRSLLQRISICQRAWRSSVARRAIKRLKLQARDVSNLRQQKAHLENAVAELKREICSERELVSQLKCKIDDLQKENVQLQASVNSFSSGAADATSADATSADAAQLQAALARCDHLEEQLTAAQLSLELLQKLYDGIQSDVAVARAEAASARSERDRLLADLNTAHMQNERLSVSSAKLAAAAAQSPTATSFYKSQASPVVCDPTVEPAAAASMHAAALPHRVSRDRAADEAGASLLEKGLLKFQAKRGSASPSILPQNSDMSLRTPPGKTRGLFNGSDSQISLQKFETAEDALADIHALLNDCMPAAAEQHSPADVLGFIKSLCSEVLVLRRVVTNTERAGAGGSNAASPRTPRSMGSFMPFMPKTPAIPPDAALPDRLRMVEVRCEV